MIAIFINIFSWIIKLWLNYDEDLEHCLLTKDSQTSTSCCPKCGSYHTIKNGSTHNGKPKRQCDTKFVALSDQIPYSELTTP